MPDSTRSEDVAAHSSTDDEESPITVRGDGTSRREVIVPIRLYKTITVFSTLLAILFVVVGFLFFDAATWEGGLILQLIRVPFPGLELDPTLQGVFGVLGILAVALGALIYILGARFVTPGMGNGKTGADESDDNG